MTSTKQHDMPYIGQSRLESIRNQIQKRLIEEKDRKLSNILQQQQRNQHQLLQNHVALKSLNVYKDIQTVRAFFAQKRAQCNPLNQEKTLPALDHSPYHSDTSIHDIVNQNDLQPNTRNNKRHKQKGLNSRHNQDKTIGDNNKLNHVNQKQQHHINDKINRSNPLPPIQVDRNNHDNSRKRRYRKNNNNQLAIEQDNQLSSAHNPLNEKSSSTKRSDQNNDNDELNDLNLGHIKNIRRKKLKREIIRRLSSRQLIQQDTSNMSIDSGGESTIANIPVEDTTSGRNSSNLQFSTRPEVTTVTSSEINDVTSNDHVISPHPPEKPRSKSRRMPSNQRNVFDNAVKTVDKKSEVDRDSILGRQSKASFAMVPHGDIESRQQTPDSRLNNSRLKTPEVRIISQTQDDQIQMDHKPMAISSYKLPDNIDNDQSEQIALVQCQICGRKFAADRLEKHQKICKKATTKKRKVFDTSKHRNQGTDNEKYAEIAKNQTSSKPKKTNWRIHHNNFIQSIKAAKTMEAHIASGGKLSDLPPPPPTENPDYVQCPHCQRKFNQTAAERHIPKCKDIKSRPAPLKRQIKR